MITFCWCKFFSIFLPMSLSLFLLDMLHKIYSNYPFNVHNIASVQTVTTRIFFWWKRAHCHQQHHYHHHPEKTSQNCSVGNADECRNNNFITATKSSFMMQKSNLKTSTYNKSILPFFPFTLHRFCWNFSRLVLFIFSHFHCLCLSH